MGLRSIDLVVVVSAVVFHLLITAILVTGKLGHHRVVQALGLTWLLLALPFSAVLVQGLATRRNPWILAGLAAVLLYMAVELVLDYLLRIPFRERPAMHVPYIILEYIALVALIGITFSIDRTWGYVVSVCFWLLLGSVVYTYWEQIIPRRRATPG